MKSRFSCLFFFPVEVLENSNQLRNVFCHYLVLPFWLCWLSAQYGFQGDKNMLESQLLEQIKIGQGLGRKRISNVRVCNRMIFQKSFSVSFLDFIGSERVGHALSGCSSQNSWRLNPMNQSWNKYVNLEYGLEKTPQCLLFLMDTCWDEKSGQLGWCHSWSPALAQGRGKLKECTI